MKFQIPEIKLPQVDADDLRIGHYINQKTKKTSIHIVGFCCDEGVKRNNGRIGASTAPDEIRRQFWKMTPNPTTSNKFISLLESTKDYGNIVVQNGEMEKGQERLGEWVSEVLAQDGFPIILGGGHETSFGHFLGYVHQNKKINILNWDAHSDVRALKDGKGHSGSPFFQILEYHSDLCNQYIVAGLQRHSFSANHLKYLQERDCKYFFKGEITRSSIDSIYDRLNHPTLVTMDMDALDQRVAPGVSAPNVNGFMLDVWLQSAFNAGKCKNVTSLDIVEFNPNFDRDNQTARVAALTLWKFYEGRGL